MRVLSITTRSCMWVGLVLALGAGCMDEPGTRPVDAAVPAPPPDAAVPAPPPDAAVPDVPDIPPEVIPDGVHIRFPPPRSLSESVSRTITVRGTASLAQGVSAVRVNGILAETSDDFVHWQAVVPLSETDTELVVDVEDGQGNTLPAAARARVTLGAVLREPTAMAVDATRDRVLVAERSLGWLVALSLDGSGGRTVVSSPDVGTGPMWGTGGSPSSSLAAIAVTADNASALVVEQGGVANRLLAVDLTTGDRRVVSAADRGVGPSLEEPRAMALDPAHGRALVLDSSRLLAVDLATGDRRVLSGAGVGAGPAFDGPYALVVDTSRDRILVLDPYQNALLSVAPDSGDRVLVSHPGTGIGIGPALSTMISLIAGPAPGRVLAGGQTGSLVEIDLGSGDRRLVGYGPHLGDAAASSSILALDPRAPDSLLVLKRDGVYVVDLRAGPPLLEAQPLVPGTVGQGVIMRWMVGIVVDPDADRALVMNRNINGLVSVDLATGDRTIVSHATVGAGEAPHVMSEVVMDTAQQRAMTLLGLGLDVMAIDLATGDRRRLGANEWNRDPFESIVMDQARGRVLAAQRDSRTLLAIDPDTGEGSPLLAEPEPGALTIMVPDQAVMDTSRDRVLVLDRGADALLAFDARTGQGSVLSGQGAGTGPALSIPTGIALDPRRDRALVIAHHGGDELMLVSLETGDRTPWTRPGIGPESTPVGSFGVMAVDQARDCLLVVDHWTGGLMVMDLAGSGERVFISR